MDKARHDLGRTDSKRQLRTDHITSSSSKRQMVTLGANYQISANTKFGVEAALTNRDLNTFSSLDSDDNVGYGLEGHWSTKKFLSADTNGWVLTNNINAEYRQANFSRIERY